MAVNRDSVGKLLSELVNRVSHGSGETLRIMAEAQVTLQQVLLLTRLREAGSSSASGLAATLRLSLPAVSQAVDRLVRMELVTRMEDGVDRRRKAIATTAKANALLDRLSRARANEYSVGLSGLPQKTQKHFEEFLREALSQLKRIQPRGNKNVSPGNNE
jgi:DNA-binding MarR family transcriptional regulator